jgi:hypothetical protein
MLWRKRSWGRQKVRVKPAGLMRSSTAKASRYKAIGGTIGSPACHTTESRSPTEAFRYVWPSRCRLERAGQAPRRPQTGMPIWTNRCLSLCSEARSQRSVVLVMILAGIARGARQALITTVGRTAGCTTRPVDLTQRGRVRVDPFASRIAHGRLIVGLVVAHAGVHATTKASPTLAD